MKRFLDIAVSVLGLVLLLPVLIVISIIIKTMDSGPVFFVQERIGKNFKVFKMIKFRTMSPVSQKEGTVITTADDLRVTKIGRFLRRTKLDEIPQLINVLKGDMSIVGPRPEVPKYVQMFKNDYGKILAVRPGLTDYAAIKFMNEEDILKEYDDNEAAYIKEILPVKILLYKRYVEESAFKTDLAIILGTLRQFIRRGN